MIKKILLLISTLAVISLAFVIYQSREESAPQLVSNEPEPRPTPRPEPRPISTQPVVKVDETSAKGFDPTNMGIPPGGDSGIRVYDPKTGDLKYVFRAPKWEPVDPSGKEFAVTEPSAEVLLPRGQMAYLRADQGQITVTRAAKNNYEPKRGWFKGHVRIIVDKTKPDWRKEHPESAEPYQHPQEVLKFWLDDVTFDLDQANLTSNGPIRIESAQGTLEGRGLHLVWNELNRRITELRITEGHRATLRSSNVLSLGIPGADAKSKDQAQDPATQPALADAPAAPPVAPPPQQLHPDQPRANVPLSLVSVQNQRNKLKENRIDAYNFNMRGNIVAEQREGLKTVGWLKADAIHVLFEVGQTEREALQQGSTTRPAGDKPAKASAATAPADENAPLEMGSTMTIAWTGELTVTPEQEEETPSEQRTGKAERLHFTATGNPVEMFNHDMGAARCRELRYFHETQQAWLEGTPEAPVRLASGPNGELIGEKVFFDRKARLARMDGPGKLIISREDEGGPALTLVSKDSTRATPTDAAGSASTATKPRQSVLTWSNWAEIHFDVASVPSDKPDDPEGTMRQGEYLKDAVFDGTVTLTDPTQNVSADHVEIAFIAPRSAGDFGRDKTAARHIAARGSVRMHSETDAISCDQLDIELTVDDKGNNIPVSGEALGNVVARQGLSEIRARESISIQLTSAQKPVTPEQRKFFEAKAAQKGLKPGSKEWAAAEENLLARNRRLVVTSMVARGDVSVIDPKNHLDVAADTLDCAMNDQQQITRATILGQTESPAHVETNDFYMRGPRILMDVTTMSAEVPGAGLLRFYTSQDLDGRPVDKPVPVVVSWNKHMLLDGEANTGLFSGGVMARSESSSMNCSELSLRFKDLPRSPRETEGVRSTWVFRTLANRADRRTRAGITTARVSGQLRRQLAYLRADGAPNDPKGDAKMEIKAYAEAAPPKGMMARALAAIVPKWLTDPAQAAGSKSQRRLVSGAAVSGPRIAVDLAEKYLMVEGKGFLLVRDYRVPASHRRSGGDSPIQATGLSSDALTSYSPGHTGFTWQNGMSFLSQRNVAIFDRDVRMEHLSGSKLPMSPELATATGLDSAALAKLKGRHVSMTSASLRVEFERGSPADGTKQNGEPATLSRATRLKVFFASGGVHMEEGTRSLDADTVSYDELSGLISATGSPWQRPQVADIDESTGRRHVPLTGDVIEWNVKTGQVRVQEPKINALGR